MDNEFKIPDRTRVRLLGHIDGSFYGGMAKTGNEGWITDHRVDANGLPEAYIKWDREHWADNQQPDRWTFEEHFEPIPEVQETRMSKEINKDALWEMFEAFQDSQDVEEVDEADIDEDEDTDAQMWDHYAQQAERVREMLDNGEAFFFVSIQRQEGTVQAPAGQLVIGTAASAVAPECEVLVGHQLSEMASRYHRDAAMTMIQHLTLDRDDADE